MSFKTLENMNIPFSCLWISFLTPFGHRHAQIVMVSLYVGGDGRGGEMGGFQKLNFSNYKSSHNIQFLELQIVPIYKFIVLREDFKNIFKKSLL